MLDEQFSAFKQATKNCYVDYVDKDGMSVKSKISHAEIRKSARLLSQWQPTEKIAANNLDKPVPRI